MPKTHFLRGNWTLGCVSMQFWDFPNISKFSMALSLKLFGNSLSNSYTKFFALDIKLCFTCGNWNLHWDLLRFPNIMHTIVERTQGSTVLRRKRSPRTLRKTLSLRLLKRTIKKTLLLRSLWWTLSLRTLKRNLKKA